MSGNWYAWNLWLLAACAFGGLGWWLSMGCAVAVSALHMWGHAK